MTQNPERRQRDAVETDKPLRLLIVDDDANYRAYASALTRRLGFWVDTAQDGEAGLQRLSHAAYDVAIIDQEMPLLSGIELIARIRSEGSANALYAMMLTAREDVDTKLTALDAGFDDFLTKASSEREIVAKLVAARRLAVRQRTMDMTVRDLYGLATRDDLTGVFNRRFLVSETERMLSEGGVVNLVLLDLDGFKQINDTFGHLAGDEVLRDVALLLQNNTRPIDVVARFGGDEFVVVVPDLDITTIERIAERLMRGIEALEWIDRDRKFRAGASAGIASSVLLPQPTLAQLLNVADRDMFKNKWVRKHPDERPELYDYPESYRRIIRQLGV